MNNVIVILKEPASKDSVIEFIESLGGYWRINPSAPEFDEGVVERGRAFVLVSYHPDIKTGAGYEPQEIEFLTKNLGVEPSVAIILAVRRNTESDTLAQEIAEKSLQRWGGYCDAGDEDLGTNTSQ